MSLKNEDLQVPIEVIRDSFRVRSNQDPVYVEVGDNLRRVSAPQHQVVYGRRGSGKSCLLVHVHRTVAPDVCIMSVYVDTDAIKVLSYPDLLI